MNFTSFLKIHIYAFADASTCLCRSPYGLSRRVKRGVFQRSRKLAIPSAVCLAQANTVVFVCLYTLDEELMFFFMDSVCLYCIRNKLLGIVISMRKRLHLINIDQHHTKYIPLRKYVFIGFCSQFHNILVYSIVNKRPQNAIYRIPHWPGNVEPIFQFLLFQSNS